MADPSATSSGPPVNLFPWLGNLRLHERQHELLGLDRMFPVVFQLCGINVVADCHTQGSWVALELQVILNEQGTTIIMVTHSEHDARYSHRIIRLLDGQTVMENIMI